MILTHALGLPPLRCYNAPKRGVVRCVLNAWLHSGTSGTMRNRLITPTIGAGGTGHLRLAGALAAVGILLSGCGGSSMFSSAPDEGSPPSITDRFNQLFGSKSQGVGEVQAADGTEPDCPVVKIRAGASTYAVALPGKQPVGSDLRYQATITRTARDCTRSGSQITARIGI